VTYAAGTVGKMLWDAPAQPTATPDQATDYGGGSTDLSGFTKRDAGPGQYDLIDKDGNVVGRGYKGLMDTIGDYGTQNDAWKGMVQKDNQWDESIDTSQMEKVYKNQFFNPEDIGSQEVVGYKDRNGNLITPGQDGYSMKDGVLTKTTVGDAYYSNAGKYKSAEEAANAAREFYLPSNKGATVVDPANQVNFDKYANGGMWEVLGQLLNYNTVTRHESKSPLDPNQLSDASMYLGGKVVSGNGIADPITGLQTLYGSTPVVKDGKVIGYNFDPFYDPVSNEINETWVSSNKTGSGYNRAKSSITREMNDPEWLDKNGTKNKDGTYFIPVDKAASNPGWKNADTLQQSAAYTPSKWDNGSGEFMKVAPLFLAIFGGLAALGAATGTAAAAEGVAEGAAAGLAPTASELAIDAGALGGANTGATGLANAGLLGNGGVYGTGLDLGNATANKVAESFVKNLALNGGDVEKAIKQTGIGTVAGYAGGLVGSEYGSTAGLISKMGTGAVLNALVTKAQGHATTPAQQSALKKIIQSPTFATATQPNLGNYMPGSVEKKDWRP